jgi:hypothetical protein
MMRGMARTSAEPPMPAGPGLFVALGNRPGIGVIVDGLYDRLERDRELARHFRRRRPGERERLKQFFETIFGGEVSGIRDVGGRLLTSAASQGSIELVRLLLDQGAGAARAESLGPLPTDRTIAKLLVAQGFDLNVPIRDQETPLTMACRADKGEHPAVVAALLELGADPNAKNAKERTPLAVAANARFDRTVALLRAAGAR